MKKYSAKILLISVLFSMAVDAGKQKQNNMNVDNIEQTRKNQQHDPNSRRQKRNTLEVRSPVYLSLCNLTPAQWITVLTFATVAGYSLYPQYVPISPSKGGELKPNGHKGSLKPPFSVESLMPLPCVPHYQLSSPKAPSQSLGAGVVHPGLYNSISTQEKLIKICQENALFSHSFEGVSCNLTEQKHARVWELDAPYSESEPGDRIGSESVYSYLEKTFFGKKTRPAELLFTSSGDQFIKYIKYINGLFLGNDAENDFRTPGAILYVRTNSDFPGLNHIEAWEAYITEHQPNSLASFEGIKSSLGDICIRGAKIFPALKNNCDVINSLALHEKMALAIEIIGYEGKLDEYTVLSENFYVPRYHSHKEIASALRILKSETLKLYRQDPIAAAALFHTGYVAIHPHKDANGRVARAVMNLLLMSAGYDRVVFYSNEEYMRATNEAVRKNQPEIFEEFLRKMIHVQNAHRNILDNFADTLETCEHDCQAVVDHITKQ